MLGAPKGKTVRITDYSGGRGINFKLRQMGLCPGREVKVIRYAPMGGPILVDVEGRSVALGRGIASRVKVEKI